MHRRTVFLITAAALFGTLVRITGAQPTGRLLKDVVSEAERGCANSMTRRDLSAFSS
jgi:hypothetical protein